MALFKIFSKCLMPFGAYFYFYYLFFEANKNRYVGDNNRMDIKNFIVNSNTVETKQVNWTGIDNEIVNLKTKNFKIVKTEYDKAANHMKANQISRILAALDVTGEPEIVDRYHMKVHPSCKCFSYNEFKFDVHIFEAKEIIDSLHDPKRPEKLGGDSEVVQLDDRTFKPFLESKQHVLIIFYVPWCPHCQKVKSEFIDAAEELKNDPRVHFAAVDCTRNQTLCRMYDVTGYPKIMYFQNFETQIVYTGGRTKDDFVRFMSRLVLS